MSRGEHTKLHYNDIFTEENRKKMSTCTHHSEETKEKISNSHKGKPGTVTGKH